MLHSLGKWKTPWLQANLFPRTQKLPCSQKDWNPNPRQDIPFYSYLFFWSRRVLGGLLPGFRLPPWSAWLWSQCHHHRVAAVSHTKGLGLVPRTAADHVGASSVGPSAQGCLCPWGPWAFQPMCLCTHLSGREDTVQDCLCNGELQRTVVWDLALVWAGLWSASKGKAKGWDSAHPPFKSLAPKVHVLWKNPAFQPISWARLAGLPFPKPPHQPPWYMCCGTSPACANLVQASSCSVRHWADLFTR